MVGWFGLWVESIVDSYGWVQNLSSVASLVNMTLNIDKF
jgi:hypothetical protein